MPDQTDRQAALPGHRPRDRKARVRGDADVVDGVSQMHVENAGQEQRFTVRSLTI